VFHLRNVCTCADISEWIVVVINQEGKCEIHVREILSNKQDDAGNEIEADDYGSWGSPRKLAFWKARGFVMDFVKGHHMGKLGGVYGDLRDPGFVISHESSSYNPEDGATKDIDRLWGSYSNWTHFMNQISRTSFK
jgi:hypothetical protein